MILTPLVNDDAGTSRNPCLAVAAGLQVETHSPLAGVLGDLADGAPEIDRVAERHRRSETDLQGPKVLDPERVADPGRQEPSCELAHGYGTGKARSGCCLDVVVEGVEVASGAREPDDVGLRHRTERPRSWTISFGEIGRGACTLGHAAPRSMRT
jgi:hypothetical protein